MIRDDATRQATPPAVLSSSTSSPSIPAKRSLHHADKCYFDSGYGVGWLFVQEYYNYLNQHPTKLHCFYNKKSQFTFGIECDEIKPRHGQQEIHQRIQELGFKDCEVKLSNIDSQTSSDGVLLQVLGEMSNQGGPAHKFAQTFFLARQTNGYFVLNDIFRFLKEEVEAKYDDGGAVTYEGSNTGQEVDTIPSHHLDLQPDANHAQLHHGQQLCHQPPPPAPVQQTNHYVSPLPVASGVTLQQAQSPSRVALNEQLTSSSGVSNKAPSPPQPTVSSIPTASIALDEAALFGVLNENLRRFRLVITLMTISENLRISAFLSPTGTDAD
ncbi:hypothetical protein SeMB42_g01004 [Synchytrium endobioticum]|uniref:NTF2 domain-containing protein n=1 Tax=Synchytrium endobioticum TaxID=286115 RepID=A0A507DNL2_9FUNG|nr:hypothetical protein SeMB42_g01004 [Synchytrium endobioticum]